MYIYRAIHVCKFPKHMYRYAHLMVYPKKTTSPATNCEAPLTESFTTPSPVP